MKTSYILLAIITLLTLTGMVATDVMLKEQYQKIDWTDPYQEFEQRALPSAAHWVIEGTPTNEIVVIKTTDKPQALIAPDMTTFYRTHQQGDTVFVAFTPGYSGYQNVPRDDADRQLRVQLVLQLTDPQSLRVKNGRLTIKDLSRNKLVVSLQKSRLRTVNLAVSDALTLTANQHSFAAFGHDQVNSLQAVVQDSSGIWLKNTQLGTFMLKASPQARLDLEGQALTWLK